MIDNVSNFWRIYVEYQKIFRFIEKVFSGGKIYGHKTKLFPITPHLGILTPVDFQTGGNAMLTLYELQPPTAVPVSPPSAEEGGAPQAGPRSGGKFSKEMNC